MKKKVAIGLLGSTLDKGFGNKRWERWRPSVSVCQQPDLLINRFELLYQSRSEKIMQVLVDDIQQISPQTQIIPQAMQFENPWDFEEVYEKLYQFAITYPFKPEEEDYLFHITTGTHVAQICFFLLTESHHFPGRLLQTSPAKDICGTYTIIDLDLSCYDRIAARFRQELKNDISFLKSGIDTANPQFNLLIEQIEKVALKTTEPILLTGPTGAGKSLLANRIYQLKKQKQLLEGNFIEVNCATLKGDQAMSSLFGHKKGAFTGAVSERPGLLRSAHQGILFLDEIGELKLDEQAMLLRAIEEKRFMPLGSDSDVSSDFQLICGTNRDLGKKVQRGEFREDLFARINLWHFDLPGLKERPQDIEPNIRYELKKYEEKTGIHLSFNQEAWQDFLNFALSPQAFWKANFRDLNAAVTRMGTLANGGRITKTDVAEEKKRLLLSWQEKSDQHGLKLLQQILPEDEIVQLDLFDQLTLEQILQVCVHYSSLSKAGRKLFSISRSRKKSINDADRLKKYLEKYGITWDDILLLKGVAGTHIF
ncbi:MAG: RNA repair transcriptional activator RtcR [Spirochaetes bacterium]|nr:RNA repair transcriptional activator RtcR [Spirochaetota bacterium]